MSGEGKSVPEAIVRQGASWELLAWSAHEATPAPTAGPSSAAPLAPAAPPSSSAGATASAGGAAPAPIAAAVAPLVSTVAGGLTVTATTELRGGIQVQAACGDALVGGRGIDALVSSSNEVLWNAGGIARAIEGRAAAWPRLVAASPEPNPPASCGLAMWWQRPRVTRRRMASRA